MKDEASGGEWGWVTLDEREARSLVNTFPFTLNQDLDLPPAAR